MANVELNLNGCVIKLDVEANSSDINNIIGMLHNIDLNNNAAIQLGKQIFCIEEVRYETRKFSSDITTLTIYTYVLVAGDGRDDTAGVRYKFSPLITMYLNNEQRHNLASQICDIAEANQVSPGVKNFGYVDRLVPSEDANTSLKCFAEYLKAKLAK